MEVVVFKQRPENFLFQEYIIIQRRPLEYKFQKYIGIFFALFLFNQQKKEDYYMLKDPGKWNLLEERDVVFVVTIFLLLFLYFLL